MRLETVTDNVTDNTGLSVTVICKVYSRAVLVSNKSNDQPKSRLHIVTLSRDNIIEVDNSNVIMGHN
jgi:hypothetical protein